MQMIQTAPKFIVGFVAGFSSILVLNIVFILGMVLKLYWSGRLLEQSDNATSTLQQTTYNNKSDTSICHLNNSQNIRDIVEFFYKNNSHKLLRGVNEATAKRMSGEVRILCWVMTAPAFHVSRAWHVRATWGRHCNKLIFMSEQSDDSLGAVQLPVLKGRDGLWGKTSEAIKYCHKHHSGEFDWLLKADDDTFVFVENLRKFLLPYDVHKPYYFGFHFKPTLMKGFNSGGAGYVFSKETVNRLVDKALDGKSKRCAFSNDTGPEDINLALCLEALGITPDDSRDSKGLNRFFPFHLEAHLDPNIRSKDWYGNGYLFWPMTGGLACCSEHPVSFHYIAPNVLYQIEYLAYTVHRFPVMHFDLATPPPRN